MFIYYNNNPNGKKIGDCVIRAISLALNLDYYYVINLLLDNSDYFNCDVLVRDCYSKILEERFGLKRYKTPNNEKVKDIVKKFENNIIIIRIDQHLTCGFYGDILDIWDCSNEIVDVFWVVK